MSTLLIASTHDPASLNLYSALAEKAYWDSILTHADHKVHSTLTKTGHQLYLWLQSTPLLRLDYPDHIFRSVLGKEETIADLIFLSRHAAASGKPSLTVHPIGIPWQMENAESGGVPGRCSPPSFRISSLYRDILHVAKSSPLATEYEVTLEATHHGPHCDKPACFVEIGSTEMEWNRPELGSLWCAALEKHFGIGNEKATTTVSSSGVAVVMLGGGHYVPKLNDMARSRDNVFIGHALTTYALKDSLESSGESYKAILHEAIQSTRLTYGGMRIICLVDKKAFNAEGRRRIEESLAEAGVEWTYKSGDVEAAAKSNALAYNLSA